MRRAQVTVACCVALVLIGYLDYRLGRGVSLALLYLLPVSTAAYAAGRGASIVVGSAAGLASLMAEMLIGSSPTLLIWNTLSRTGIFLIQGWLVATLQEEWRREADLARRDPVTGLANSRTFNEVLTSASDAPHALAFIDLDNFKTINDRFGHSVGDDVLVRVAQSVADAVRSNDVAARLGGDEFAVLLRGADIPAAEAFAGRLHARIRAIGEDYPATGFGASVGIVVCRSGAVPADEIIRAADEAMYAAKARGKATTEFREYFQTAPSGDRGARADPAI